MRKCVILFQLSGQPHDIIYCLITTSSFSFSASYNAQFLHINGHKMLVF